MPMFFCVLKMPPPSIDFVLPSPTIGLSNLPIVDPPWMPHFKTKVEEVTINQKESVRNAANRLINRNNMHHTIKYPYFSA